MTTQPSPPVGITEEEREELTRSYLPLVRSIAVNVSRKAPASMSIEDLVGAGMVGLVDAASRYDPSRADRFRTFAASRVRGAMIDELRSQGPLSRDLRMKSNQLSQTIRDLERDLGRQPDQDEIAAQIGIDIDKYHKLLIQLRHATILSPMIVEQTLDRPRGYPERVPGNPQDDYLFQELRTRLAEAVSMLSEREQRILAMYYQDELSLKEIGARLDVTESRICQLRSESVHRLRAILMEDDNG